MKKGEIIKFVERLLAAERNDGCVVWPGNKDRFGYPQMRLGKRRNTRAQRFICERAHGAPPTKKYHAAHSCGNNTCVNPHHLRWATAKENIADKILHDRVSIGQRNGSAKLTPIQVHSIRMLYGMFNKPQRVLGRQFGVGKSTIASIVRREKWQTFA